MPTIIALTPAPRASCGIKLENHLDWWRKAQTYEGNSNRENSPFAQYPDSPTVDELNDNRNDTIHDRCINAREAGVKQGVIATEIENKPIECVLHCHNSLSDVEQKEEVDLT